MLVRIVQVTGVVAICVGAAMIYPPAGVILAGVFAVLIGISLERGGAG